MAKMRSVDIDATTRRSRKQNFVNVLPLALIRARESITLPFRNLLRRYNLTEPQWRVMRTVAELADAELTEVSRVTALPMPSLSRIVRELEARGYLERKHDPDDMRCMLVHLTERGYRLVDVVSPECGDIYDAIKKMMGREKLTQLQGLLAELEVKLAYLDLDFDEDLAPGADVIAITPPRLRGRPPKQRA